ncbi:hypothetical protein BAC2_00057 [uncultured bacterium]|nr:hypothetical protein BAC2_00057 [uncultured bacterium]
MGWSRTLIAGFLALFLCAQAAWAAVDSEDDRERVFMQGVINARGASTLILNEHVRVNLTKETKFFDSRAARSNAKALAQHRWLYVEGVKERDGSVTAEEVYFLPGYVEGKDKSKYGFMQLP